MRPMIILRKNLHKKGIGEQGLGISQKLLALGDRFYESLATPLCGVADTGRFADQS